MKKLYTLRLTIVFITCSLFYSYNSFCQTYQWAAAFNGADIELGDCIDIDGSGNVYTGGNFGGIGNTVDFDPGPGTFTFTSLGSTDIFISKLDASGNFVWARQIGNNYNDECQSITHDASGDVIIAGAFQGTVDFNPGAGSYSLTEFSTLGFGDAYVCKLSSAGNFVWARKFGGSGTDVARAVTVDAAGNVYITGYFQNTVDFDPGPGTTNLTSAGLRDIFICKLDPSGNFIWAKRFGSTNDDHGFAVCVDGSGNVYTTGLFQGTTDFDPGAGTFNLTASGFDVFISKLNSAGNFVWAQQLGGTGSQSGEGIVLDVLGNVYLCGTFQNTTDFDPGPGTYNLTSAGSYDIFVNKLDAAGNFIYAKQMGGTGTEACYSLKVDGSGNVYTTGTFSLTADFDPGAGVYNLTATGSDMFINKLDATGNFVWAVQYGGTSSFDYAYAIALDGSGGIYTTGSFNGTVDFDPGIGTYNLNATGIRDAFVLKLSDCAVPASPTAINGSSVLCTGTPQSYSVAPVAGATSYSWSLPGGWTGSSSSNTISATPGTSGVFSVTANSSCGTSAVQTLSVTVNTIPSTPGAINGLTSLCTGSAASNYNVASVAGATSYSWSLAGGWSGSSSTNSISATPGTSGIFSVAASNSCGISAMQTLSVTVNPLPTINVSTNDSIICGPPFQYTTTLTANGASTYTWNTSETTTAIVVSPSVTTNYTVTGTDNNGCMNSSTFTQSVSACIGISELPTMNYELSIYPNPTAGKITISGISSTQKIEIYNVLGESVYSGEIENEDLEIDLYKESPGLYFLKIGKKTRKIVKE